MTKVEKERLRKITCTECRGMCFDSSMATEEVWKAADAGSKDILHFACLAKRLGRLLTLDDFSPAPINAPLRYAVRHIGKGGQRA